jgi:hypothetical protein
MRDRRLNSQPSCNQRFRTNPLEQVRYGRQQDLGGTQQDVPFPRTSLFLFPFPSDYGFGLGVVYLLWIFVVVLLFPVCLWYARLKERRKDWWLSYV